MAMVSNAGKARIALGGVKSLAKHPKATRAGIRVARRPARAVAKLSLPLAKHSARRRIERVGEAARTVSETLVIYGPQAAQSLGLVEPPKEKRTAPRVAAGVVIGASAVYFLEPEHGREHREKVLQLVA